MNMADNYRGQRFKPETDPDNYAAIAAALKQERENSRLCGPGYEEIDAPTSGKGRGGAPQPGMLVLYRRLIFFWTFLYIQCCGFPTVVFVYW